MSLGIAALPEPSRGTIAVPAAYNLLRIPGVQPEVRQIARRIRDRELTH